MALTIGTPTVLSDRDKSGQLDRVRIQRSDVDMDSLYEGGVAIIIATTQGGTAEQNEIQTVTIAHAIGGIFIISDSTGGSNSTSSIPYNASAAVYKTTYEALANVGAGNTTVTKTIAPDGLSWTYTIEYINTLELTNRNQVTSMTTGLSSTPTTGEPLAASSLDNTSDSALIVITTTKTPSSNGFHKAHYNTSLAKMKAYSSTSEAQGTTNLTGLTTQVVTIGNKA